MRSVGASPLVTPFQSLLGSEVNARFCPAMFRGKQTEILCMQGLVMQLMLTLIDAHMPAELNAFLSAVVFGLCQRVAYPP